MPFVTVTARIHTDSTGAYLELPVILTTAGPLIPLLDYCVTRHDRSISWMKKLVSAVSLFLDYLEVNPSEPEMWRLFRNFAQRLYAGSFDIDTGLDPSGLCWQPLPQSTASYIVIQISDFFEWLGNVNPSSAKLNPRYQSGSYDQRIHQMAYLYRRSKAFLGHTWIMNAKSDEGRFTRIKRAPKIAKRQPPEFPDERLEELLFKGFQLGGNFDYRGMLITLLMHGAGFRVSETFHLYVADVAPHPLDETTALVYIHHPSLGIAPDQWRNKNGKESNRQEYLATCWGMKPRTELMGNAGAGWKNPLLDGKHYMRASWFDPIYGKWFLQLWGLYMRQVAMINRNHPFAFVNLHREPIGAIYTMDSFRKAHRAAVLRIGLPYGKSYGTTDHGHRHSYAQRLRRGGIEPFMLQEFMHHRSIDSQEIYTRPTWAESIEALEAAAQHMQSKETKILLPERLSFLNKDC
jgi:site-specific recombinase XerD